jgi:hypothetical protein
LPTTVKELNHYKKNYIYERRRYYEKNEKRA